MAPILLIGLNSEIAADIVSALRAAGYQLHIGRPSDIPTRAWTAVVGSASATSIEALELLSVLEASKHLAPPLLVVGHPDDLAGIDRRVKVRSLAYPFNPEEIIGAIGSLLLTSTLAAIPRTGETTDKGSGEVSETAFRGLLSEALVGQSGEFNAKYTFVASVRLNELETYVARLMPAALQAIAGQLAYLLQVDPLADELHARGDNGAMLMLLPNVSHEQAKERLSRLSERIAEHKFRLPGHQVSFTPTLGYTEIDAQKDADVVLAEVRDAAAFAASRLDVQPVLFVPVIIRRPAPRAWSWIMRWTETISFSAKIWTQFGLTTLLGVGLPFVAYWLLGSVGWDITHGVYLFVVFMLGTTALSIWMEGLLALKAIHPPDLPAKPFPQRRPSLRRIYRMKPASLRRRSRLFCGFNIRRRCR